MKTITLIGAIALATCSAAAAEAATTSVTGGGQSFNISAPALAVTETVSTIGIYPSHNSASYSPNAYAGADYLASIDMFAGSYAPTSSYGANGQTLSIAPNQALFALLGTTYGGNGTTTFQLPDFAGRAATGAGSGAGLTPRALGEDYGSTTASLTVANLPSHAHSAIDNGQVVTTSAVGGNQAFDSAKPSLAITYLIQTQGVFPNRDGSSTPDGMVGQIGAFAGNFVPQGFALANGQLLSIAQNQVLFSILGTTYGGNGTTNFALPDLVGRSAVGVSSTISLGEEFGQETTTLSEAQMPAHQHVLADGTLTNVEGASAPIANYGPSLGLHYIIATSGIFPNRNSAPFGGADPDLSQAGSAPALGEISLFAGTFAPTGWVFAEGQTLLIAQNQALFALLGTTYGGDGVTTFNLPDFRGRTALGTGTSMSGLGSYDLGETVGSASYSLGVANLPPHAHLYTAPPAVPEPASWAMMIAGFGLVGGSLRRRASITGGAAA